MLKIVKSLEAVSDSREIFLASSMRALLEGCFDGTITMGEVMRHGDFGLGTFDALDGEMVACDGRFFQALSDGTVRPVDPSQTTPFATVLYFQPTHRLELAGLHDFASLTAAVRDGLPRPGQIHALRVRGEFSSVEVRVVHKESKPYPGLGDLQQSFYQRAPVRGTVVGFNFPPEAQSLEGPEFHLHFLSDDHAFAGHLTALAGVDLTVEMSVASQLRVALPPGREHDADGLTADQIAAMHRVEGPRG